MEYEQLEKLINQLREKYHLSDFRFDSECIYELGNLSDLMQFIVNKTLPDKGIEVTEKLSDKRDRFIATLKNQDRSLEIFADTNDDFLPDDFFNILESIPEVFGSDKKFISINPLITLQDIWYICGMEQDLINARNEGLPLLFPGEDLMETDEFKKFLDL